MSYQQRPSAVPGVVVWQRDVGARPGRTRILPDGCMDLIWDGLRLFVAGPDSTARMHESRPGATYRALRFSNGVGPALLGVSADELRDRTPELDTLWPSRAVRELTERVADEPVSALRNWAARQAEGRQSDPVGVRIAVMTAAGVPVSGMADTLNLSPRQLHRRTSRLFGYGPRRLARVLRMTQALESARAGTPLADVAGTCGYADQAHLTREVRALTGVSPLVLLRER